jgi:cell division protein FtsB
MKEFFRSKLGSVVLSVVLLLVLFGTGQLFVQKYRIDKQIKDYQAKVDAIKGQNAQLSDLVNYLNTPQYKEKEAREKLNLQKPGEVVVSLPQDQPATASATTTVQTSNPKKWFDYFFKKDETN